MFLYARMFVTMLFGIYTSRIVLEALGETNFGIYNVVGGIVIILNFLNATLVASTQRYINMSLGERSASYTKDVFSAAIKIHHVLSLIIVLLAETIGFWFMNTVLTIPEDRVFAANVIYQFSIVTVFLSINTSPLQAMVISQEKMGYYAILSMVSTFAKFLFAYYLLVTMQDRLIVYGGTLCLVGLIDYLLYRIICSRNIEVCRGKLAVKDKSIYKSMLSFSSWALIGSLAGSLSNQGINILLNIFFGPAVNAARGLAMTFNNYVYSFVANFTIAVNPQIVKTYASNEYESMYDLLLKSIKFSVFLFAFLAFPVLFEAKFILGLWLKEVPEYTTAFCQIIVLESFVSCAERPMATACNAIGCVKQVNLSVGVLYMLSFVVSWGLLLMTSNALIPFIVHFVTILIGVICFLLFIGKYIHINKIFFVKKVVIKSIVTLLPPALILAAIHYNMEEGWRRAITTCIASFSIITISIYYIGFDKTERSKIISMIKQKIVLKL